MPIKAIIFDKDGTLHDTEKLFFKAWHLAAEELGVPDMDTTAHDCTGRPLQGIARYWEEKYGGTDVVGFDVYLPVRQKYFNRLIAEEIPLKAGAIELLAALRERGYKIGLATSSPWDDTADHLTRSGMASLFDAVVTGDMVREGKPHPDMYLLAAAKLGVDPAECVGVEDSLNGVESILAAGMRAIMVPDMIEPTPEFEARLWARCDTLADILPLVETHRND